MTAPWTRHEASASGQVFEFRLWAALVEQSRGGLHVFLPLADRGIDSLVHRLSDDVYFRVQAKGRASLVGGEVRLAVWAAGLLDDSALLVAGLVVEGGLGPMLLVVPVSDFKRLASLTSADGEAVYSTGFGMRPRSDSRWLPWLTPVGHLAERFGVAPSLKLPSEVATPMWRSDVGSLGEAEVVRLLAVAPELNLFRPFPDLETSELAVLHLKSRNVLGLQVKTIGIDAGHPDAEVTILASSFRPSPTTYLVVLAWRRNASEFHDECLLIPSAEVQAIAEPSRQDGHIKFAWHPGSKAHSHLEDYRRPVHTLGGRVSALAFA